MGFNRSLHSYGNSYGDKINTPAVCKCKIYNLPINFRVHIKINHTIVDIVSDVPLITGSKCNEKCMCFILLQLNCFSLGFFSQLIFTITEVRFSDLCIT